MNDQKDDKNLKEYPSLAAYVNECGVPVRGRPTDEAVAAMKKRAETARAVEYSRELLERAGLPDRNRKAGVKETGDWGKAFQGLVPMLGSGFLVGFVGFRGTGKTQMATELVRLTTGRGKPAFYTTLFSLLLDMKETWKEGTYETERGMIARYSGYQLLVIDEVSMKPETDWASALLFEVVNRRYGFMHDTIIIGSCGTKQFLELIGPSLASRMQETGMVVEMNWESFREKKV